LEFFERLCQRYTLSANHTIISFSDARLAANVFE
jgi:hypothetical protein